MRPLPFLLAAWIGLLAGCSDSLEAPPAYTPISGEVTPSKVSQFGYEELVVEISEPVFRPGSRITIHGNEVYDVSIVSPRKAHFYWQGAPGEKASIDIERDGRVYRLVDVLELTPLPHPAFERMVGIGASFGQGVMSLGFDQDMQVYAPSAQIARQAGNYYPLPLTKRGFVPHMRAEEFDENCRLDGYTDELIYRIDEALAGFLMEDGRLSPRGLRIDPDIAVQNISVGGSKLESVIKGGAKSGMPVLTFLEHLVYDGDVDWEGMLREPEIGSQLDYAVAFQPTMVITVDIAGNDVLPALGGGGFHADRMPDDEYFYSLYGELFERLGPEVWVFIADLPDITLIPDVVERRRKLIAEGRPVEEVDAELDEVRARLKEINAILKEVAAPYPRAVIVPFSDRLDEMAEEGLTIGGVEFTVDNFGGFISLDTLHLTRVGYAVLANVFIEKINQELGTKITPIDLEPVAKVEPETPDKLAKYGLTPENCTR